VDPAPLPAPETGGATGGATGSEPDVRGRVRDAVIDIAPGFCFTLTFALTQQLTLALALALTGVVGVGVLRLIRSQPVWRVLGTLVIVGIGAGLAGRSGDAVDFFLPGLVFNVVFIVVQVVMMLLRWPPLGVAAGLVNGEGTRWRRCPVRRRAFARATLLILAGEILMISIQVVLFLAGEVVVLGTVDTATPIVFVLSMLVGWRIYRRNIGAHRCAPGTDSCADPERVAPTASPVAALRS
jgi:hypothetical protein